MGISVGILRASYFHVPPPPGQASFAIAEYRDKPDPTIVTNRNGATVGKLVGDGFQFGLYKGDQTLEPFQLCVIVSDVMPYDSRYAIDFGSTTPDYKAIIPVGMNESQIEVRESILKDGTRGQEICAVFDPEALVLVAGTLSVFPVYRLADDWESEDDEDFNQTTVILLWGLGGFYCVGFTPRPLF